MTQETYHVSNPIEFQAITWPFPADSLVFWSKAHAGGVLLFLDIHYIQAPGGKGIVFSLPELAAGDVISIVTFA